jgi:hypothetical protein
VSSRLHFSIVGCDVSNVTLVKSSLEVASTRCTWDCAMQWSNNSNCESATSKTVCITHLSYFGLLGYSSSLTSCTEWCGVRVYNEKCYIGRIEGQMAAVRFGTTAFEKEDDGRSDDRVYQRDIFPVSREGAAVWARDRKLNMLIMWHEIGGGKFRKRRARRSRTVEKRFKSDSAWMTTAARKNSH